MASHVGDGDGYQLERPETLGRNLQVGTRVLVASVAFFFVAFLFAYFYLRALNSNAHWRPPHVNPGQGYGTAVAACAVGSAVVFALVARRLQTGAERTWRIGAAVTLVLALAAIGVQAAQFTNLGFKPDSGGYASVFFGWTWLFMLAMVGALYWVETLFAQSLRGEAGSVSADIASPSALLRPSADACALFLLTLAGVAVIAYVVLYLV